MANINDKIKVKLTEHGRSILEKDVTNTLSMLKGFNYQDYSPYHTDEEGYTEFTLWDFMRIFGSHFQMGCQQIIEQNEIIFLPVMCSEYAFELFDEYIKYINDCLEHNWRFINFNVWLAEVKKLSDYEIQRVAFLIASRDVQEN